MEKRVLIIEDDPVVRGELARALEHEGVRTIVASDGVDGLARLHDGLVPSAILLDLRAPRLGGDALLRAVRADARYERVPVITMGPGAERGGPDVVAHVPRSFDVDDLLAIVLSLFEPSKA